ncbi:hypothetical protein ACWGUN_17860 [Streptomyces koyangensis]
MDYGTHRRRDAPSGRGTPCGTRTPAPRPSRVWLVTGAGRGLGRAFAEAALAAGDRVAGAARDVSPLDAWRSTPS